MEVLAANKISTDFQTPKPVARYMASLIPDGTKTVLEPTPGVGHILSFLSQYDVTAPENFFAMEKAEFDCVITNPPFSSKYAFGVPDSLQKTGMRLGYHILLQCLEMSNSVIALMPWFTISDSDVRLRYLYGWGMKSITALPRKTFQYARIQTCVFEMEKGFKGPTIFKVFDQINDAQYKLL